MEEAELEHSRDGPRRESMNDRAINDRKSEQRGVCSSGERVLACNKQSPGLDPRHCIDQS